MYAEPYRNPFLLLEVEFLGRRGLYFDFLGEVRDSILKAKKRFRNNKKKYQGSSPLCCSDEKFEISKNLTNFCLASAASEEMYS